MLELRGVRHRYDGRLVLDLDQFIVPRGALLAVVGHNGAGKSTLLRLLALLETPTEGQVLFSGALVPKRARAALRRRITLVEQRPILFRGTVRENLEYGLALRGTARTAMNGIIGDLVERLGLASLLNRRRHDLSAGEGVKHAHIGGGAIDVAVMTDRVGPAVLAVGPSDIFVSLQPLTTSARNVFSGRITGMSIERRGAGVHVRADMGGVELVAAV